MYEQNYPQNAPNQGWQAPQQGGGQQQKRTRGSQAFPVNKSQLTGAVLPMSGKYEDRIEVKQIGENKFVTHFLLEVTMPGGPDQNGQQKVKRLRRKVNAFTNAKITKELLFSLYPGMVIKVTAEDADESYVDRNGNKVFREVKNAYYIEIAAQPQPAAGQPFYPQGAPVPGQQPYGGGYPAPAAPAYQQPAQPNYYPQGAPMAGQQHYGGYPAPAGPAQPQAAAPAYQGYQRGPAPAQPAQPAARQQATPPYYQAPGQPAAPETDDDDLPPDIAGPGQTLDI